MIMDGMSTVHRSANPFSRLWGFWARRRAKHDQEYIAVLSSPDGAKDVHAAHLAQQTSRDKSSGEAGRGFLY